jgi:O-antigen ligase
VINFFAKAGVPMSEQNSALLPESPAKEAAEAKGAGKYPVELLLLLTGVALGAGLAFPAGKYLAVLALSAVMYGLVLIKPQRSLWLVISYALIDYVVKQVGVLSGSWDELTFILIVGTWVVKMAWDTRARYKFTSLDWYLVGFLMVSLFLLLVRSPDRNIAIEGLRAVVEYLFWFFVAVNMVKTGRQVRILTIGFILLVSAISLYGIYQYIIGVQIPVKWIDQAERGIKTRVFSIIGSPNILGSLLVMTIPMTVSLIFAVGKWWKRLVFTGLLGIMGLCLLFTYSRGAWLALVGAMLYYGIVHNRKVLALFLIAAVMAPAALPSVTSRMGYMLSPEYIQSSQKGGRLVRWDNALDVVKKSPIAGVGLGRYGGAVATNNRLPGAFYVDNYYLKTLAEMGALGLGAMLWLFLNCMRFGTNAYRRAKDPFLRHLGAGIMAGLLGLLLHNAVENVFEVPMINTYFWFLLGMVGTFPYIRLLKFPV